MPIYSTNPRYMISDELQSLLWRNGMKDVFLGVSREGQPQLTVQGMDSPVMTYNITEAQAKALTQGGYNSLNRKAYETFCQIVGRDFDLPQYINARVSHSMVNMGQNGYRIGLGEYGRPNRDYGYYHRMFPRHHGVFGVFDALFGRPPYYYDRYAGFPLRRVNDHLFYQGAGGPMVAERPDGTLRPGEVKSGTNGIYWKGTYPGQHPQNTAVGSSADLNVGKITIKKPWYEEHKEKTIPYDDVINKKHPFTVKAWQDVLRTHGIDIDPTTNKMRIRTLTLRGVDEIDLTKEQVEKILAPKLPSQQPHKGKKHKDTGVSLDTRLAVLNAALSKDFTSKVTMSDLKKGDYVSLTPKAGVKEIVDKVFIEQDKRLQEEKAAAKEQPVNIEHPEKKPYKTGFIDKENSIPVMDGRALDAGHGWYLPVNHGKAVTVGEIIAYPAGTPGKETTYKMSAVINGDVYTHDISQKDYLHFLNQNDDARLRIFDKVFDEVSIKAKEEGDGLQYAPVSGSLAEGHESASLKGEYSLFDSKSKNIYIITGATAWHDKIGGDYVLNVRESGDIGMWQFHMSKEQFDAFRSGDDDAKAKIIEAVGDFHNAQGSRFTVEKDSSLDPMAVKLGKGGIADNEFVKDLLEKDKDGLYHDLLKDSSITNEGLAKLRGRASGFIKDHLDGVKGDTYVSGESREGKMENRYWARSGKDGRETTVSDIVVKQLIGSDGKPVQGKYQMSAVIDGNVITHDITEKDMLKFRSVNDYERLKLFDKIFDEVKMKHKPGTGINIGAALAAAATVILGGAVAYDAMRHMGPRPEPRPGSVTDGFFYKDGVAGSDYVSQMHAVAEARYQAAVDSGERPPHSLNIGI